MPSISVEPVTDAPCPRVTVEGLTVGDYVVSVWLLQLHEVRRNVAGRRRGL